MTTSLRRKRRLIVVAPSYDDYTKVTVEWAVEAITELEGRGIEVLSMTGDRADRLKLLETLRRRDSVVFIGHGCADSLLTHEKIGDLSQPLSAVGRHGSLFSRADFKKRQIRDVHFVAYCCYSGKRLGRSIRRSRRGRFLGFSKRVYGVTGSKRLEQYFRSTVFAIIRSMIGEGGRVRQGAIGDYEEECRKRIRELESKSDWFSYGPSITRWSLQKNLEAIDQSVGARPRFWYREEAN